MITSRLSDDIKSQIIWALVLVAVACSFMGSCTIVIKSNDHWQEVCMEQGGTINQGDCLLNLSKERDLK